MGRKKQLIDKTNHYMGYRGTESHLKPRETEDCICKVYIGDLNSG